MAGAARDGVMVEKLRDSTPHGIRYNPSHDSFTYDDDIKSLSGCDNRFVRAVRRLWNQVFPLGFKDEFFIMFSLSWPAILTTFFQFFLQTTSVIMCGQLGKIDLDSVALANSFINVAGICIGVGMSTACDTLFSQTYGGRNKKRMGMYLQRGLMVMYCALLLLWCLHLNIRPVLLWLGQNPVIADKTAQYMLYFMPGLFFDFSFLVLSRFLQNQNVMYPSMIAGFIGNVFNLVSQYIAIHLLGYAYVASAVLQASSLALMFFVTLGYTVATGIYKDTWDGWKLEALYGWWDFIKLAVPGIFLIALEEWSFEIATIIAGTLGEVQLGAQSIVFQLVAISYMIPFGVSVAVNIRVGHQLGGNESSGASNSYRVGLFMMTVCAVILLAMFSLLRNQLPYIFSSDPEIVHVASNILPIIGAFQIADGICASSCGAIRGCGRQIQGAAVLFIGFYLIGLPLGISLALTTELQVMGMWIGLLVGYLIEAVAFCWLVLRLNWRNEAALAQIRAYGEEAAADAAAIIENSGADEASKVATDLTGVSVADASQASRMPSDAETEYSPLMSNSYRYEIAFYSDPECSSVPVARYRRRGLRGSNQGNRGAGARRHTEFLYTGRFYSRSHSVHFGDSGDEDDEEEVDEAQFTSGDSCINLIIVKRLVTVAVLVLLLVGALALRLATGGGLPLPEEANATSSNWFSSVTPITIPH